MNVWRWTLFALAWIPATVSRPLDTCTTSHEQSASLLQSTSSKRKVQIELKDDVVDQTHQAASTAKAELLATEGLVDQAPSVTPASSGTRAQIQICVTRLKHQVMRLVGDLRGRLEAGRSSDATVPVLVMLLGLLCLFAMLALFCIGFCDRRHKEPLHAAPASAPAVEYRRNPARLSSTASAKEPLHAAQAPVPAVEYRRNPARLLSTASVKAGEQRPEQRKLSITEVSTPQSALTIGQTPLNSAKDTQQQFGSFLCPGLVVPEDCECSLRVPRLDPRENSREVTVDDASGVPVFKVIYSVPTRSDVSPTAGGHRLDQDGNRCLVIASSVDDTSVFASCRLGLNGALTILDNCEKPFGLIRSCVGKGGFEVATRLGSQIHLGISERGDLAATDRRGRTLALTEPQSNRAMRLVRIGPFVDAGLITLAVLAVDLLEKSGGG